MTILAGASVLVTGGAGTVGSTLVDQLLDAGVDHVDVLDDLSRGRLSNLDHSLASGRTRLLDSDVRDRDAVHDATVGKDLVFHEAAPQATRCQRDPRIALETLVDGTFNVLEAAAEHGVDKVILGSGSFVYGAAQTFPTVESQGYGAGTFVGAAEGFMEDMARCFRATRGLSWVALRYFSVYGPRMDVHSLHTSVLVRWMESIAAGRPPVVYGDGSQTIDFVYVADAARANILAAESKAYEGVYNIASGTETSLLGLAVAILKAMNSTLRVEFGARRGDPRVPRSYAAISAAVRDLGFRPQMPLDEGLRRLVDWWLPLREEIAAARVVALS